MIIVSVLLSGCAFWGGESREGVDKGDYDGGAGLAIALRNNGTDPFTVEVTVLSTRGPVAWLNETLAPGDDAEKWWTLDRTTYSVRMAYHWDGDARASTGLDDVTVDLNACPLVSRISFDFRQEADVVGHTTQPNACVSDDEE